MDMRTHVDWLTTAEIFPPLRRMAGDDARLNDDWTCERFKDGQGETLGVWRVSGTMSTPGGEQPWSLVLKGWACADDPGSPDAFNSPWREAHLYQSGLLAGLPGVSAPACHGSVERDGAIWAWLDDLTVFPQPAWTVERFATTARRLGQFNGAYLTGRPIPNHPSLSQRWLEGWVAMNTTVMEGLDESLRHPRVRAILPPEVASAFRRIWDRREATFAALRSMPQVFAHLDAFHQNIFFRPHAGQEQMVLIDWSFAGRAAPGEDLAPLCIASATFDPAIFAIIDEAEQAAIAGYLDGLRDAGWSGDEADIRRAYRSSAVLRYGPGALVKWLPTVRDDTMFEAFTSAQGIPGEFFVDHMGRLCRWLAERADDA